MTDHPYRVSFQGNDPYDMKVYTTDAEGNKTSLRVMEATITIKPDKTIAHIVAFRPTLDLEDIPTSIEVVTPNDLRRERKELQKNAKHAFDTWLAQIDHTDDRYHQFMMEQLDSSFPHIFVLHRKYDQTGVSGTGFIAAGIEYQDTLRYQRPVHLFWMGQFPTKGEYTEIMELMMIHNHDGNTEIVWLDEQEMELVHVTDEPTKG